MADYSHLQEAMRRAPRVRLGKLISQTDTRNSDGRFGEGDVRGISTGKEFISTKANLEGVKLSSYKVVAPAEFCYVSDTSRRGDKMAMAYNETNRSYIISSIYTTFKVKDEKELLPQYLYLMLCRPEFDRYARFNSWGSARETFDWTEMECVQIPLPPVEVQEAIVALYRCAEEAKKIAAEARALMRDLCPALVQRAANSNVTDNLSQRYR